MAVSLMTVVQIEEKNKIAGCKCSIKELMRLKKAKKKMSGNLLQGVDDTSIIS